MQQFKKQVLDWLAENKVFPKKVRVFNTRRYGFEVRVYGEAMEIPNTKKSRRKMEADSDGNNCTYGIHSRKYSSYVHINKEDFSSEDEKQFILECLKNI